jgi:hypothetical protein
MHRALPLLAVAAVLTLTGCGASSPASHAHTVAKPSCDQQMTAWVKKSRAATAVFNKDNVAVVRAQQAGNVPGLRSALERQGKAAKGMEAVAIPECADPKGYYAQWLDRFIAAGDNARSQGGLSGLELELEPMKGAPALRRKLNAELNRRTQYSGI